MVAILFLLVFLLPIDVGASVLGDIASKMSAGTFQEIPKTASYNRHGLNGGIFVPDEFGCASGDYTTQFADNAAYDSLNGVIRFLGQTHGNCTGGQFVRYNIATDVWDTLAWPSTWIGQKYGDCGGGPCLNHEWDMWNAIRPSDGRHFAFIASQCILEYNPSTNAWSNTNDDASCSAQTHPEATQSVRYFPEMDSGAGRVVYCNGSYGCWKLNLSTNTWTCIARGSISFGCSGSDPTFWDGDAQNYNTQMAYSSVDHVLYFMTGNVGLWKISATGAFTKLASCPVQCRLTSSASAVDPVSGELVMIAGNNQAYAYSPSTNQWRQLSVTVPSVIGSDTRGQNNGPGDGLIATALADYGVIWFAKYTGSGSNGVFIYKHTTGAVDSAPPTTPTNLTATAISSTQIDLAWTGSTDNVGVTGYQVERCTGAACSDFTLIATPQAIGYSNNTGLTASTLYRYRIRATDLAGNLSGYSSIAEATTPAAGGPGADFTARCAAPGVVRCWGFDQTSDLKSPSNCGTWSCGANYGSFNNNAVTGGNYNQNNLDGTCGAGLDQRCPEIDFSIKASGGGSLKFTQPATPLTNAASAQGQWYTNFSTDYSVMFGENQQFWIQWRQRFDNNMLSNIYNSGDGFKQLDTGAGDLASCPGTGNATNCPTSNNPMEIVIQNVSQRSFAQAYRWFRGSQPGFTEPGGLAYTDSHLSFQNMRPDPYCLYDQQAASPPPKPPYSNNFPPYGNCFRYVANEWMTFKIHVQLGPISGGDFINSVFELFGGREGQALVPLIRYAGPIEYWAAQYKYGKVWLLPYHTNMDSSTVAPEAHTWYDELIISSQDIADPGAAPPQPNIGLGQIQNFHNQGIYKIIEPQEN